MDYKFPDNLKYTSTHEWVKIDDEEAIVGITDYAQYQLGDIVFVELPDIGMVFEKGSNAHDDEFKDLLNVEQYKELVEKEDH